MTQKIEVGACTGGSWHIDTHVGLDLGLGAHLGCPFALAAKMYYVRSMQRKTVMLSVYRTSLRLYLRYMGFMLSGVKEPCL